jgi:hypothetical protein
MLCSKLAEKENAMPWKPEYAEKRRKKYQENAEERERRKSQSRAPEENKEYMRKYYQENPDKFVRTPEMQERHNKRRRERYATDPEYAEKIRQSMRGLDPKVRRNQRLKANYGISQSDYESMLRLQNFSCKICGKKHSEKRGKKLHVDHCHENGHVRGLLCTSCNTALGKMKDDVDRLKNAIRYLEDDRKKLEH